MRRFTSLAFAASVLVAPLLTPAPAVSAEFGAFRAACLSAQQFLIGEVPEGKNAQPVLDVLCPCLETGFAEFSQPEIDALEVDLRTGAPDNAYEDYEALQKKATEVLGACFASDEVMAAAREAGI